MDNDLNETEKHDEATIDDVAFEEIKEDGEGSSMLSFFDKQKKLKEKLKQTEKEKQEYLDGWQRLKADYVNLKKRSDEEKAELSKYVKEGFVTDLIPVIESFDMAFANKEAWEKVDPTWRVGVEYIHKQFMETLGQYGLTEVTPLMQPFDPQIHTAIVNVETHDLALDHKIAAVIQKGYALGDRIIKSPKVHVYSYTQKQESEKQEE